jgi:co-chaperonin GroES (HSP10)
MINIDNAIPIRDLVIVKMLSLEAAIDDLIVPTHSDETDIAVRYGEVIHVGPNVQSEEHCPGLTKGDTVLFTEYAGYYISSKDTENLYKVMRGYDIIGKTMKEDNILDKNSTIPTGNRVLVELIDFTNQEDGVIYNARDPKLADLSYGKIVKINESINKLKLTIGQMVAFAPYVGTFVQNYESSEKKALKIIVEDDILFTV